MVIARLQAGASLHSKSMMFPGEMAYVDIRCNKNCMLLILTAEELTNFGNEHKKVKSKVLRFQKSCSSKTSSFFWTTFQAPSCTLVVKALRGSGQMFKKENRLCKT